MAEKIKIDVCMAATDAERLQLIEVSKLFWQNKGYRLLNDQIGPDSVKVYEGKIEGAADARRYRPVTKYAKEPLDEPIVLVFIKD